ncbi:ATLS1-like light-inducible protein [cyanobiont of Ornithocercus magnificus]|nr:ATLS1-like light-inducible protein [cyanobiont of Ornithocercus magnificus]
MDITTLEMHTRLLSCQKNCLLWQWKYVDKNVECCGKSLCSRGLKLLYLHVLPPKMTLINVRTNISYIQDSHTLREKISEAFASATKEPKWNVLCDVTPLDKDSDESSVYVEIRSIAVSTPPEISDQLRELIRADLDISKNRIHIDFIFPQEVHKLWLHLDNTTAWVHGYWNMYRELYSSSQEAFDLHKSAGSFFGIVQHSLLDSIQLSLCKLNDPAGSGNKENMTLCALRQRLNLDKTDISRKIEAAHKRFSAKCEQMKERRNKQIAHSDKKTILDGNLMGPTPEEIDSVLTRLSDFMNYISKYYNNSGTSYRSFSIGGGASALHANLRRSLRYNELVNEKVIPEYDYYQRFPNPCGSEKLSEESSEIYAVSPYEDEDLCCRIHGWCVPLAYVKELARLNILAFFLSDTPVDEITRPAWQGPVSVNVIRAILETNCRKSLKEVVNTQSNEEIDTQSNIALLIDLYGEAEALIQLLRELADDETVPRNTRELANTALKEIPRAAEDTR